MKHFLFIVLIVIGLTTIVSAQEQPRYTLIWSEEFDSEVLNDKIWSKIPRNQAEWAVNMTSHDSLYAFVDGNIVLRGVTNTFHPSDNSKLLTGGIWTKYKKNFGNGRLEIRAKFTESQGFWPAIWLLPQKSKSTPWPYAGEIDIMEHFQTAPYIDHTVHTYYTYHLHRTQQPKSNAKVPYNKGEFNVYAVEKTDDSLIFFVNGERTFVYPRYRKGEEGQFPFSNQDYYLILDAQLGASYMPVVDTTGFPAELWIDYVRFYEMENQQATKKESWLRKLFKSIFK